LWQFADRARSYADRLRGLSRCERHQVPIPHHVCVAGWARFDCAERNTDERPDRRNEVRKAGAVEEVANQKLLEVVSWRFLDFKLRTEETSNLQFPISISYGLAGPLSASDRPRKNFLPFANTMFLPTARVEPSFA